MAIAMADVFRLRISQHGSIDSEPGRVLVTRPGGVVEIYPVALAREWAEALFAAADYADELSRQQHEALEWDARVSDKTPPGSAGAAPGNDAVEEPSGSEESDG